MLKWIKQSLELKSEKIKKEIKRIWVRIMIGLSLCFIFPQISQASFNVEKAGDILQFAVPLAGYGATFLWDDESARMQWYKSIATDVVVVFGMKNLINKKRPNGGSKAFPSGHTSLAFVGASFIQTQYGFKNAIPAYIAASFVGYSRIQSKCHDLEDVIAGALIGMGITFYFHQSNNDFTISPFSDGATSGVSFSMRF